MTDGLTGAPTTVCGATLSGDVTTEMSSPGRRGARSSSGTSGITNGVVSLLAASDETTGVGACVSLATCGVATAAGGTALETTFAAAGAAGAVDGAAALTAGALATTGAVGATAPADGATGAAASVVVLAARAGAFLPLAAGGASAWVSVAAAESVDPVAAFVRGSGFGRASTLAVVSTAVAVATPPLPNHSRIVSARPIDTVLDAVLAWSTTPSLSHLVLMSFQSTPRSLASCEIRTFWICFDTRVAPQ